MASFQTSITIQDTGVEFALAELRDRFRTDAISQVMIVIANYLKELLAITYPPQTNAPLPLFYRWSDGTYHKFKTLKQQRYVMGVLVPGGKIPYKRRHNLMEGAKMTITAIPGGAELNVTLQGDKGKYVFGKFQSNYFKKYTLWKTDPFNLRELERNGQVSAAILYAIDLLKQDVGLT